MSLTIKEQFNRTYPDMYSPYSWNKQFYKDGLFLNGVDKDIELATKILQAVQKGRIDLFCQEDIFCWLKNFKVLVNKNTQTEFSELFFLTMQSLVDKTDSRFKYRGYKTSLNKEYALECIGFGGQAAFISYGLNHARYLANCEVYKHIGIVYGKNYPSHFVERPGKTVIFITNPRYEECANNFEGRYIGGAKITKTNENCWKVEFEDYLKDFEWNSVLWSKIYNRIKPTFEFIFDADISINVQWQFED